RGRLVRAADLLPRRRVLPRQPGDARPHRSVAGQGDRPQGRLRRLPAGARARLPGGPPGLLRGGALGRRERRDAGLGRHDAGRRRRQLGRHLRRGRLRDGLRRRLRPHHAPGPLLPVARSRLRHRPLRLAARERGRLRAGDGGAEAVQRLLPRPRRRARRPAGRADQAGRPLRAAARADRDRRARPAARRGRAVRAAPAGGGRGRRREPIPGRGPRVRAALLLDSRVPPGLRGDRRLPEGRLMTDVLPLVSPWGRFGLYSFFIDAPEPAVVDTGIATSPAEGMAPALEAAGRRVEDVRWILLTHGHIDHVGGAHALWELTGRRARVVIHEADAPMLRSRRAHVAEYLNGRGRYLRDPDGEARTAAAAEAVISGEMEPDVLVKGG